VNVGRAGGRGKQRIGQTDGPVIRRRRRVSAHCGRTKDRMCRGRQIVVRAAGPTSSEYKLPGTKTKTEINDTCRTDEDIGAIGFICCNNEQPTTTIGCYIPVEF